MSPSLSLHIRAATPDDVPWLLTLVNSAYRGDSSRKGWTTEADLVAGQRIDAAELTAKITHPRGAVFVAYGHRDEDGNAVPTACCEVAMSDEEEKDGGGGNDSAVAYFGMFAVDPRKQSGGIGREVLQHTERYAREALGARRMEMTVLWMREELIAWYVRRGYKATGERRPFPYGVLNMMPGTREDLYFVVLVKDLAA